MKSFEYFAFLNVPSTKGICVNISSYEFKLALDALKKNYPYYEFERWLVDDDDFNGLYWNHSYRVNGDTVLMYSSLGANDHPIIED